MHSTPLADSRRERDPAPPMATGVAVLEWGSEAAVASFELYKAAFRERPGFPAWSQAEWLERLTGDPDFLHGASLCALLDGEPAGFVVCSRG
jgi:mycothiol synthase